MGSEHSVLERIDEDFRWTRRQRQVLGLIEEGHTNPEIAARLGVSLEGAKWHVREILTKLEVSSREEAAEYWRAYNQPGRRMSRAWRHGVVSGVAAKWAAGVLTVAAGAGVTTLVIVSSSSDGEPNPAAVLTTTRTVPTAAASVTPTPEPPSPTPDPRIHPFSVRTGNGPVDRFLELLEAGDGAALAALAVPIQVECTSAPGIDVVPCEEGEAEGTPIDVLPTSGGCEGVYARVGPSLAAGLAELRSHGGVYGVGRAGDEYRVFLSTGPDDWYPRIVRLDAGGGLTGIGGSCGDTTGELFEAIRGDGAVVLEPVG